MRSWPSEFLLGSWIENRLTWRNSYIYVNAFPEQECVLFNKAKGISKQVLTKISNRLENLSDVRVRASLRHRDC